MLYRCHSKSDTSVNVSVIMVRVNKKMDAHPFRPNAFAIGTRVVICYQEQLIEQETETF